MKSTVQEIHHWYAFLRCILLPLTDSTSLAQHIASISSHLEILRILLLKGASVHLRNMTGHTPMFMAVEAGLADHVSLLRESGAHLHPDELRAAKSLSKSDPDLWVAAGVRFVD